MNTLFFRVKQALWALLKIDANELVQTLNHPIEEDLGDDSEIIEETMEEKELKLHRIILLRSWLLHFISNIHDYFMTRVVQSTQIDLGKCKLYIKTLLRKKSLMLNKNDLVKCFKICHIFGIRRPT